MAIIRIDGKKYFDRQITTWLAESIGSKIKFNELRKAFDDAQDRRTKIANAINARDNELRGKEVEAYIEKRRKIEAEETAKIDGGA